MSSLKNFADLKSLRADLKMQEEARKKAEAERIQHERQAKLEADLFRRSIGDVAPLPDKNKLQPIAMHPLPIARQHLADEQAALEQSLSDEFDVETLLDSDDALSYSRPNVGPDVVRKLRKGHWVIQDQLDLHGMRREEARERLAEFLRKAAKRGLRCVRIIHGKGLGSVNKEPVLKAKVHSWLVQKDEVMAFCVAKAADGGNGALLVLLRGS